MSSTGYEYEVEPCDPEFIDGSYEGCGECEDCREQAIERVNHDNEMGHISDDEAREQLAALGVEVLTDGQH